MPGMAALMIAARRSALILIPRRCPGFGHAKDHATQRVRMVTPPWGRPSARAAARMQKWDHMLSWISLASRSLL
jgi:hypothetical protein